ncbi:MAG: efflux RND transporter permease subunit, partial [Mariniblastus sp.]
MQGLIIKREDDVIIRLADVATVSLGSAETSGYSWVNDSPVIFMTVQREPGSNV